MPTPDEGCVTISPYHVNDPNSWVDLVHNESIVRCPYCKINASIRQQDGRTWIAYYKGITAFVAHLSAHEEEFQKDQDNHPKYRGKSGKTERIKDATVPMTKEQKEAYHRNPKGEGYTGKSPFESFYTVTFNLVLVLTRFSSPSACFQLQIQNLAKSKARQCKRRAFRTTSVARQFQYI
jgi:hypothetical protein